MQILQWLFKIAEQEPPRIIASNSTSITQKQCDDHEEEKIMRKDFVILITNHKGRRKHATKSKVSCENLMLLRLFYQTLNLKGLGCFEGCRNPLQKKKKKKTTLENKVLPLSQSWSRNDNSQLITDSDNKPKTTKKSKKKAVSRMKELLKWAATAKVLKGAAGSKAAVDDDESPKISFRLEMEDHIDDEIRCAAGIGNWITTDSEFVVLEL